VPARSLNAIFTQEQNCQPSGHKENPGVKFIEIISANLNMSKRLADLLNDDASDEDDEEYRPSDSDDEDDNKKPPKKKQKIRYGI
jgi:hypothetical protein